ncbi:MAG: hypothetical protein OXC95_18575 [Dehalococcoidia bacterium]|nr:hypothetical protein [Dehalococcoidia bacterium]
MLIYKEKEGTTLLKSEENPIDHRHDKMVRRHWGDGRDSYCIMNALVPGAKSIDDCVAAGWPRWLASLCIWVYDIDSESDDQMEDAIDFARQIAEAIRTPTNYEKAKLRFLLSILTEIGPIDKHGNVEIASETIRQAIEDQPADFEDTLARMDKNASEKIWGQDNPPSIESHIDKNVHQAAVSAISRRAVDLCLRAAIAQEASALRHKLGAEATSPLAFPTIIPSSYRTALIDAIRQSQISKDSTSEEETQNGDNTVIAVIKKLLRLTPTSER